MRQALHRLLLLASLVLRLGWAQEIELPPSPPPQQLTDAYIDAEFAASILAAANGTGSTEELLYTTEPNLERSFTTSKWLSRDQTHVTTGKTLNNEDTTLREGGENQLFIVGNLSDKEQIIHMTRHGLYRRADVKFEEFVAQPTGSGEDGYGLWRTWESRGPCPRELLIADPWGSVSWEAPPGHLRARECSWVVRPGMYLRQGYFRLSRAPIALSFRTFHLAAPFEVLDIYDGAHPGSPLLARITGQRLPDQITSTGAEVRIVLITTLDTNVTKAWQDIDDALATGNLREAQARFIVAARCRMVGFYRQPMRRILKSLSIRMSKRQGNAWLRREWFSGSEHPFERAYNESLVSVLEDLTAWDKRSRHDEGKDDVAWDGVLSVRRYPSPVIQPERNPYHGSTEADVDKSVQLQRYLGNLDDHLSGFSLDFTTSADCSGKGIAPYGEGVFPPLTVSSEPRNKEQPGSNFDYLPFPIQETSCQPMLVSGPQTTRDRPFTVADTVMKDAQEDQLRSCLHPGQCDLQVTALTGAASNCTRYCDVFMQCVQEQMGNRSAWKVGRNMYNKSLAAAGRDKCVQMPEAALCVNVQYPPTGMLSAGWWTELGAWTREAPKNAICLDFTCLSCAIDIYRTYFNCAHECSKDPIDPTPTCIDCSYSFEDSYEDIDGLRDRFWEGYLSGSFGFHLCPDCNLESEGMMGGGEIPMSRDCRRCHYALEDLINNDPFTCIDSGLSGSRCFRTDRGGYNFEQDFYLTLKEGMLPGLPGGLDLTMEGNAAELAEDESNVGYNYGA
jgi:hypothetical protein